MEDYDPLNAPDPDEWQSMDEDERITLVMEHHREAGVELPNEQLHAVVHVVVENKIALGDEMSAQATLERLMREGLDRHETIHAVGSVLVDFVQALIRRISCLQGDLANAKARSLAPTMWFQLE